MTSFVDTTTGFAITSWGWAGDHRLWRVRSPEHPGELAQLTGPADGDDMFVRAWKVRDRLPWTLAHG